MPRVQNGLYRNENGRVWLYHFKFRGQVFKGSTGCESKTTAKDWLAKYRERLAGQEMGLAPVEVPTLRAVWEKWDRLKAVSVSASHRRWMRGVIHQHTGSWIDRPISDLDTGAIEELKASYLSSEGVGYSKTGQGTKRSHTEGGWNKVLTQIRALVGWAVEVGLLSEIPFKSRRLPVNLKARGILWPEQVRPFLAAVDAIRKPDGAPFCDTAMAVRMMIGLGLRESEALHAEWSRLDDRRGVFIVAKSESGRNVKDHAIREIPVPSWLHVDLSRWRDYIGEGSSLIIPSSHGGAHFSGATTKAVRAGAKALKISNLTPHRLRATFATCHFEVGTPLTQIAQMMGHDDPSITLKHYIVQRPKDQAEAQEKAASAMGYHVVTL